METPRPILDLDNLEAYEWPEIDWDSISTKELIWVVDIYRQIQLRLFITHMIDRKNEEYPDPDPYAKHYVFYCMTRP